MKRQPIRNIPDDEGATITMELTTEFAKTIRDRLNIEIEMLQGIIEPMPDGRTRYIITVTDPDKMELLREFALKLISNSHNHPMN
jgi:hypothetical protein